MASYTSMFKEMMEGAAQDIQQTARKVAKKPVIQEYINTLYPGKTNLVKELNETIATNPKMSAKWMDEKVQDEVLQRMQKLNIPEEKASELAQSVHAATYKEDIDALSKSLNEYTDKTEAVSNLMKKKAEGVINKGPGNIELGLYDKITKYPQAYFSNPDKKVRNTRIGTAVGTYAALSVGGRYLQGGTLTTDQYGRKDIAGIPFL